MLPEIIQMLHSEEIDVKESVDAVREAGLFRFLQFPIPNIRCHAFLPADVRQAMSD
jgi:hypothetical protein